MGLGGQINLDELVESSGLSFEISKGLCVVI